MTEEGRAGPSAQAGNDCSLPKRSGAWRSVSGAHPPEGVQSAIQGQPDPCQRGPDGQASHAGVSHASAETPEANSRLLDLRGSGPNQDQHWYGKGDRHGSGPPENVELLTQRKESSLS